jgi:hypothetical protein
MCSCRLRTTCSSSAIFPMAFLLGCGTPACFHERSIGGRRVAAYRAIGVRYRRAELASGQPDRRTFPGSSVRITCLATAVTGGAVRLSSLWSLLRGRSPRPGAGLAVARTGWCARGVVVRVTHRARDAGVIDQHVQVPPGLRDAAGGVTPRRRPVRVRCCGRWDMPGARPRPDAGPPPGRCPYRRR